MRVGTRTPDGVPHAAGVFPDAARAGAWVRARGVDRLTWAADPDAEALPPPVWYLSHGFGPLLGLWQPPVTDPLWWTDADGRPSRFADPAAAQAAVRDAGGRLAAWTPQAVAAAAAAPDPGGPLGRLWHPWPQPTGWRVWQIDPTGRPRVARQPSGALAEWARWADLAQWAAATGQRLRWFAPPAVQRARLAAPAPAPAPRLARA